MEIIFALLRYATRKFQTHLIMNYLFPFAIPNLLLLQMKVDIIQLIPTIARVLTCLIEIHSHVESMFQTVFILSIRVLLLY
jgi:hypothetical protein